MDGKKRESGVIRALLLSTYNLSYTPKSYDEIVELYLNIDATKISKIIDMSNAVKIGMDKASIPNEWINILTNNDEVERARWLINELRKEM